MKTLKDFFLITTSIIISKTKVSLKFIYHSIGRIPSDISAKHSETKIQKIHSIPIFQVNNKVVEKKKNKKRIEKISIFQNRGRFGNERNFLTFTIFEEKNI